MSDSIIFPENAKVCTDCGKLKRLDQYYKRSGAPHLRLNICKSCMRERARNQTRLPIVESAIQHEQDIIDFLLQQGIPALPGKALAHRYADIVAWGCVMIEVKYSSFNGRKYRWSLTPRQRQRGLRGHVVVLIAESGFGKSMRYWMRTDYAGFYNDDGSMKSAICYTPDRAAAGMPSVLTDDIMENARGAWYLINHLRDEISQNIKNFGWDLLEE